MAEDIDVKQGAQAPVNAEKEQTPWQQQLRDILNSQTARMVGVLLGLSASIALGLSVLMWSGGDGYKLLYGDLTSKEAGEVVSKLQLLGIDYKLDPSTGAIMVASDKVHEARITLAAEGLPRKADFGFEQFNTSQEFGVSQFAEKARYRHALETELSRTISSLNPINKSRVHLALPKETVFARTRKEPSASVVVDLYPGASLEKNHIEAIMNLVASGIPSLSPDNVTVVDSRGRLLSSEAKSGGSNLDMEQMEYVSRVEDNIRIKIEDILRPVMGKGRYEVQVTADVDFTVSAEASEIYDAENPVLRSEQIREASKADRDGGGVPGALSNQPPGADNVDGAAVDRSSSREAARNYEIGKTYRKVQYPTGRVQRVSIAVVVDHARDVDEEGNPVITPLDQADLDRITALVRESVGFNEQRGDTVEVINAPFVEIVEEEIEGLPLWRDPWVLDIAKQAGSFILVLAIIFGVIRPLLRRLFEVPEKKSKDSKDDSVEDEEDDEESREIMSSAKDAVKAAKEAAKNASANRIEEAKKMVGDDPKMVAQLVKEWLEEDGGR